MVHFKGDLNCTKIIQENGILHDLMDVDYVGNVDTRKYLLDFMFMLFGITISWEQNQQPIVTLFTTQAEILS